MSNARKITRLLGLMVLMAFAFTALTGTATAAKKSKKAKVQRALLKKVKKNPAIVKNKKFIKKAAAADFELPVTVRFDRCLAGTGITGTCLAWGGSNDTVNLDLGKTLGNVGNQTTTIIDGVIQLWATFADPRDGDEPGNLRLSMVSNTGPSLTSTLTLSGVDVLSNADITGAPVSYVMDGTTGANGQNQTVGTNGCSDIASGALEYGITAQMAGGLGIAWASGTAAYASYDSADTPGDIPGTISDDIVFRTASILAEIDSAVGDVNLFDGNVDLTVNTTVTVNAVFREQDNESPMHCMEALTGASVSPDVSIRAQDSNGLEIDPAITKDGKLRLANVTLGQGPISRPEIEACLAPIRPYDVQVTGMWGMAIDLLSAPVAAGTGTSVGVDDLSNATAISVATGGAATTADFRLLDDPEQAITCGTLPAALSYDGAAYQINPLYTKVAPMAVNANHVELRPDVSIGGITAEGLIGHFSE